jgi:hypothetical protein
MTVPIETPAGEGESVKEGVAWRVVDYFES